MNPSTPLIIFHDERCADYASPGHPERPFRVTSTAALLKQQEALELEWRLPKEAPVEALLRCHDAGHLEEVRSGDRDFDADTPRYPGIYQHALRAAGAALDALDSALEGRTAFSLMRPPGHHATAKRAMGFCFFSSMAVAVMEGVRAKGKRMAVLEFDVHHGNGTEDILCGKDQVLFTSIHQSPCYPGTGLSHRPPNCRNYPLPPETPRKAYREAIASALEDIRRFGPDVLAVSAGFDAYVNDPIAQELLEEEDFYWIGEQLVGLDLPTFHLLEGGYSEQLAQLIQAYLYGMRGVPVEPRVPE